MGPAAYSILVVLSGIALTSAQLQLSSAEIAKRNNITLPLIIQPRVLEGEQITCSSQGQQKERAQLEIDEEIQNMVLDTLVLPVLCPGQHREKPAFSCFNISETDCNGVKLPSGFYWVMDSDGTVVQVYCNMNLDGCRGSAGGWTRVAYLNMIDPTHQCPPAWREISAPKRTCGRTYTGCNSAIFSTANIPYLQICGRVIGYQFGATMGFLSYILTPNSITINEPYVDGVSITRRSPREHIWSFSAAWTEDAGSKTICPCTNSNATWPHTIPPWVEGDYFCETAATGGSASNMFFAEDPLWDGHNCGARSTCCKFNNPPWFSKQLNGTTVDDIEVRICADENISEKDTPIELIEIYVQ